MKLNNAIKKLRDLHSVKQADLAKYLEITPQHLSDLERGKHKINLNMITKISKAFRIPEFLFVYLSQEKKEMKAFNKFDAGLSWQLKDIFEPEKDEIISKFKGKRSK